MNMPPLRRRPAWTLLEKHYQKLKAVHLRQLFADDRERGERLAIEAAGLYLDYSKKRSILRRSPRRTPSFSKS